MTTELEGQKGPESDRAHLQGAKPKYRRWTEADARRWKEYFGSGKSILEIAAADKVDSKIVSQWLHRLGVEVYQGRHRVEQLPLKIPNELAELLSHGPDHVLKFLDDHVWGLTATESGAEQLKRFCRFIDLHKQGTGVLDIASQLQVQRSSVSLERIHRPAIPRTSSPGGTTEPDIFGRETTSTPLGFRRQPARRLDSSSHSHHELQQHPEGRRPTNSVTSNL
jgi:hypothetical protein